jgi:hypothetical protein
LLGPDYSPYPGKETAHVLPIDYTEYIYRFLHNPDTLARPIFHFDIVYTVELSSLSSSVIRVRTGFHTFNPYPIYTEAN